MNTIRPLLLWIFLITSMMAADPIPNPALMVMENYYRHQAKLQKTSSIWSLVVQVPFKPDYEQTFQLWNNYAASPYKKHLRFLSPNAIQSTTIIYHLDLVHERPLIWIQPSSTASFKSYDFNSKHSPFSQTHFLPSDILGRTLHQDTHTIVKEDYQFFTIKSIPKDDSDPYGYILWQIDKKTMIAPIITYYQRNGKRLKTRLNRQTQYNKPIMMVTQSLMVMNNSQDKTLLEMKTFHQDPDYSAIIWDVPIRNL